MRSEVGIDLQSLYYGFLNEIMDNPCSDGGPGSDRIGCTKFCEGCTKGLKCVPRWGSTSKHFHMGSKMKLWTIHVRMGVSEAIRLDVPNLMKDVLNFVNDVPNFVKDVPRVPKCVPRWGSTPNNFLMGSKMKSWIIHVQMVVPEVIGLDVPNLMNDVPNFVKDVPNH